jgi:alpha-N-arabinofuranosidase
MKKSILMLLTVVSGFRVPAIAQEKLTVNADQSGLLISKHIYGHFSEHLGHCIYGGYWVGEDSPIPHTRGIRSDVVQALKEIQIPNLRWPGGCFADEYHWMDGIGPRERRPKMVNTHWGGVTEDNGFGTHEFLDLCEQLGCEPYISGNLGSGSVEEMSKWVEYITFDGESPMANLRRQNGREKPWKVRFWGVGNESWGCGGNMTPDYYADLYRRYATYCRNYGGNRLFKIACGPNEADYNWTETVMKNVGNRMQGLSLHYYTIPSGNWGRKGSATQFDEAEYFNTLSRTLFMEELIRKHATIMERYDPEKRIGLMVDEWGVWTDVEPGTEPGFLYQQNTLRDAILAAVNLNIFNRHCDRVKMTNIAQTVNVLQAVILTEDEKMLRTPTYWVYWLYKVHQEATLLPVSLTSGKYVLGDREMDAVSVSASRDAAGRIHLTLVNIDPNSIRTVETELWGVSVRMVSGKILTSEKVNDFNSFDHPDRVGVEDFGGARLSGGGLSISLPAKSVVLLEIE